MTIIERNNVTIQGNGGQPIIFSHGYGCDQTIWRLVAPAFETPYDVVLFDHVGAGKSDTSKYNRSKYNSLQGYADDLVEIADCLDISGGIFVGHSVGSMIGLLAAIKNPRIFERLILVTPSPCYFDEGDYRGGFSNEAINQMLQLLDSNYEAWAKAVAPLIIGNSDRPDLAEELMERFCRAPPEIARHFAHVTFLSDNRRDLPKVTVPSLILQCSEDSIAPETVGEFMHQQLRDSELWLLKATGHCPHLSAPEETKDAIFQYLEQSRVKADLLRQPGLEAPESHLGRRSHGN